MVFCAYILYFSSSLSSAPIKKDLVLVKYENSILLLVLVHDNILLKRRNINIRCNLLKSFTNYLVLARSQDRFSLFTSFY